MVLTLPRHVTTIYHRHKQDEKENPKKIITLNVICLFYKVNEKVQT